MKLFTQQEHILEILTDRAKSRKTIPYFQLAREIRLNPKNGDHMLKLFELLGKVGDHEILNDRPPINSLAINPKNGDDMPGYGFFRWYMEKHKIKGSVSRYMNMENYMKIQEECFNYWGKEKIDKLLLD